MTQGEARCPTCVTSLMGRWCHACGQDTEVRPHPLRAMAGEAVEAMTSLDSRVVRTVRAMVLHPARILESYRSGASGLYVTPLKLFVVLTALFIGALAFTGVAMMQVTYQVVDETASLRVVTYPGEVQDDVVAVEGAESRERWLIRPVEPTVDPRVEAALRAAAVDPARTEGERAEIAYDISQFTTFKRLSVALSEWLPHMLWLLMPLHALALAPIFGRQRLMARTYLHFIMAS